MNTIDENNEAVNLTREINENGDREASNDMPLTIPSLKQRKGWHRKRTLKQPNGVFRSGSDKGCQFLKRDKLKEPA